MRIIWINADRPRSVSILEVGSGCILDFVISPQARGRFQDQESSGWP